ncbi:MAG: RHS repeat-associated core domain-containing protein, partial [Anaerolineae bacterium]
YDAANRLSSVNGVPLSYDNNGNLLSDGTYSYSYDSANRLKQMSGGTSITNYAYNGDGLHVLESLDGIDTVFVQDVAASLPHVLSASSGGSRTLLLWGLNLIGESAISAGGADWQFMLPDAIGSVRQITDMSGQVTLNQMYDPFGNVLTSNGAADSRYGFTGEEQADSGHVYLRSRTYNPASGRFLQQDMVFGDPSSPRTMHRYAYGFNNPVNYTDPSGRMPAQGGHAMPVSSGRSSAVGGGYVGGSGAVSLGGSALAAGGLLGGIGSSNGSDGQSLTCFIQDLSAMYGLIKDAAQSVGQEFGALVGVLLEAARDPAKWGEAAAEAQNHIANINVTVTDTAQAVQTIVQNNQFIQNTLAAFEVAAQIGAQVLIALSPFDEAYDAVSLYLGYDLISGEVLSDFEKKLIIGGMVLGLVFSVGDAALTGIRAINNVVQNSRVARNSAGLVDDLGGLGLAGARSLENISAGRHVKVNVKTSKTRVANNESNVISSKKNKFTQIVKTGYEINKLGIDPILIFRSSMLDSEAIHEIASFAAKNGPKASHKLINLLDRLVWLNYDRFIDAGSITKRFRRKMFNRFKKSSINENIQIARDELAASVWWDELFSKTPGSFPTKEQLFDLGHVEQYWLKRLPTFDEMRLLTAASKREFGVRPNRATNAFPYVLDVGEFSQVNVLLDEDFIFHTHPRDVGLLWPIPSPADREVFNLFEVNNITSKTKYVHHGIVIPEKGPVIRHRGIDEPIEIYFGTAEELVQ